MHRDEGDENRGYQQRNCGKLRTVIEVLREAEHGKADLDGSHTLLVGDQQRPKVIVENGAEAMDCQCDHHSLADGNQEGGQKADIPTPFKDCRLTIFAAYRLEVLPKHEYVGRGEQQGADNPQVGVGEPESADGCVVGKQEGIGGKEHGCYDEHKQYIPALECKKGERIGTYNADSHA